MASIARNAVIGSKTKISTEENKLDTLIGFHRLMYNDLRTMSGRGSQPIMVAAFFAYIEKLHERGYLVPRGKEGVQSLDGVLYPYAKKPENKKEIMGPLEHEAIGYTTDLVHQIEALKWKEGDEEGIYRICKNEQELAVRLQSNSADIGSS